MTIQRLNELYYLSRLIEREKERLAELRSRAIGVSSPVLSDMPKAPGAKDRIGELVPVLVDETAELEMKIREAEKARHEILDYIGRVPFSRIKLILTLRYIDQMSWMDVAEKIGGKETEYSVKQACYRYVEGKTTPDNSPLEGQMTFFDVEFQQPSGNE